MASRIFRRVAIAFASAAAVFALGAAAVCANEVVPLGWGETHTYPIQIYASTGYYTSDVTRPSNARGSIEANLTSTSGVSIQVCSPSGAALAAAKNCYNGTSTVFVNRYGGLVQTTPRAKALFNSHSLGGSWIYKDL